MIHAGPAYADRSGIGLGSEVAGRFQVGHKELVTPVIAELRLNPIDEHISFRPGQYVLLEDLEGDVPPRSYSVANGPRPDGSLRLLITDIAGGTTSGWIHRVLKLGDVALATGPFGTFVAEEDIQRPVLFLAAGSGLAPALALIEERLAAHRSGETHLFLSVRNQAHLLEGERLQQLAATHPRFTFQRTFTRSPGPPPVGRIPRLLFDYYPNLATFAVYVSGAPAFVSDCSAAAAACCADPAHLHTEEFFGEPAPW